ncbi:MAG: hypothetical protein JJT77_06180 [Crocinitomicaceae bacterium]|nr:hypothetical protein [Crocinitomicaceae bacterium]
MKKSVIVLSVIALVSLASCGGGATTPCDCANALKEMTKDYEAANMDEAKMKKLEEKYKQINDDCEALVAEIGQEKYQEEFLKCLE